MLYNVNDHGRPTSGLVYECLRYQNSKESKKKKLVDVAESNETDFDIDELVLFFESCKLPQDTQKLKDKLAETADSRRGVLTQNQRNFPKMFNMYRVDPSLVKTTFMYSLRNHFYRIFDFIFVNITFFIVAVRLQSSLSRSGRPSVSSWMGIDQTEAFRIISNQGG